MVFSLDKQALKDVITQWDVLQFVSVVGESALPTSLHTTTAEMLASPLKYVGLLYVSIYTDNCEEKRSRDHLKRPTNLFGGIYSGHWNSRFK